MNDILTQISEYLHSMWRFRWAALAMAWALALLGWLAVYSMPDEYRATARVYVDTESTLRPLMRGLYPDTDVMSEVALMTRAVLFRPNLEKVAKDTDLDMNVTSRPEMEELITELQQRVSINGSRDSIFTISFTYDNRRRAEDVVEALVDAFVENSLGMVQDEKEDARKTLDTQIQQSEVALRAHEERLKEFKQNNYRYMSDQGDFYEQLKQVDDQIKQLEQEMRLVAERRNELQRQLAGEEPVFGIMGSTPGSSGPASSVDGKIRELELRIKELQLAYTDKHPDIIALKETIAQLETQRQAELEARGPVKPDIPAGVNPLDINPVYQNLRIQLSEAEVELATLNASLVARREERTQLERSVDTIQEVATQWARLNRGFESLRERHEQFLERRLSLQTLEGIEQGTRSVKFREIEPPFAAEEPVGPNRPLFLSMVLLMALGGGAALAFVFSQLRPTFHTRETLRRVTGLPVLGSITLMLTPRQRRLRRLGATVLTLGFVGLGALFVLVVIYAQAGSLAWQQLTGVRLA